MHYSSDICKRLTRSFMASAVHALVPDLDFAFLIRQLIAKMLNMKVTLNVYVHNRTVFDVIAKDGPTSERRVKIYIHALHQSYTPGELEQLGWIPGHLILLAALRK